MCEMLTTHKNILGIEISRFDYGPDHDNDWMFTAMLPTDDGGEIHVTYHLNNNDGGKGEIPLTSVYEHLSHFKQVMKDPARHNFTVHFHDLSRVGQPGKESIYLECPTMGRE